MAYRNIVTILIVYGTYVCPFKRKMAEADERHFACIHQCINSAGFNDMFCIIQNHLQLAVSAVKKPFALPVKCTGIFLKKITIAFCCLVQYRHCQRINACIGINETDIFSFLFCNPAPFCCPVIFSYYHFCTSPVHRFIQFFICNNC